MSVTAEKWKTFRANSSNFDLIHPNLGASNLQADWHRGAYGIHSIHVNGIPLRLIADQFNSFGSKKDVLDCITQVILADLQLNEADKILATGYLATTFHQGGLLYPVSGALATQFKNKEGQMIVTLSNDFRRSFVNIITTSSGFKIQEYSEANKLIDIVDQFLQYQDDEGRISPEEGESCVIKAEAILDVDFTQNPSQPSITVENNHINILHKGLRPLLDDRNLVQMIMDFFRYLFGLNQVRDISPSNIVANDIVVANDIDKTRDEDPVSEVETDSDSDRSSPLTETSHLTHEDEPTVSLPFLAH